MNKISLLLLLTMMVMPSNAQNSKVHKEYYEDGTLKKLDTLMKMTKK